MKILCTGDLHLGRRSSRLPSHLDDRAHSAAGCWDRIVDLAIAESVAAVVLSGDLVDRENRMYESIGPLEAGIRRLADAGITTIAVAGNHDFDVLPRIAGSMGQEAFHLLGVGGRWERLTLRRGDEMVHIDGWSFPEQYVREDPVAAYDLPVPDDGPVLGLLHADLDTAGSPYAPVSTQSLQSRHHVDFWLLGHIHLPGVRGADGLAPILYPGSPQALDPGETGAHGAWILELEPGRRPTPRLVPLSSVRYEIVEIDLDGVTEIGEVDGRIMDGVRSRLESCGDDDALRYLSCRLRVTGRTELHSRLEPHLAAQATDLALHGRVSAKAVVEKVVIDTKPALKIDELARGNDPVGVLARLIQALDDEGEGEGARDLEPEHARLLRAAERAALEVDRSRAYIDLVCRTPYGAADQGDPSPRDAEVRELAGRALRDQAHLLLDSLISQKEGA